MAIRKRLFPLLAEEGSSQKIEKTRRGFDRFCAYSIRCSITIFDAVRPKALYQMDGSSGGR